MKSRAQCHVDSMVTVYSWLTQCMVSFATGIHTHLPQHLSLQLQILFAKLNLTLRFKVPRVCPDWHPLVFNVHYLIHTLQTLSSSLLPQTPQLIPEVLRLNLIALILRFSLEPSYMSLCPPLSMLSSSSALSLQAHPMYMRAPGTFTPAFIWSTQHDLETHIEHFLVLLKPSCIWGHFPPA